MSVLHLKRGRLAVILEVQDTFGLYLFILLDNMWTVCGHLVIQQLPPGKERVLQLVL